MSQIIQGRIIDFVIHLVKSPDINSYQATADLLAGFLLPCPLPSWSLHVQRVIATAFLVMFCQSSYILYVRSKTKKVYHIGLNSMGLIRLDRANHCGLFYLIYSILAVTEIIWGELAQSGHLDQGVSNFILGINFTLTGACASVILWLCICHYALVKQSTVARRTTPVGKLIPTTVTWALNIFLGMFILVGNVLIFMSFFSLNLEYRRVRQLVSPVVEVLRKSAPTCTLSTSTCSVDLVVRHLLPLKRVFYHIDLLVKYTKLGLDLYIFFAGFLLLLYTPFLFLSFKMFEARLNDSFRRRQKGVFANTLIEFTVLSCGLVLVACAKSLVGEGDFIFRPKFWLIIRIGINVSVVILGNIALFLILCNLRVTAVTLPDPPIVFSKL